MQRNYPKKDFAFAKVGLSHELCKCKGEKFGLKIIIT